jgi:hypothetical protein
MSNINTPPTGRQRVCFVTLKDTPHFIGINCGAHHSASPRNIPPQNSEGHDRPPHTDPRKVVKSDRKWFHRNPSRSYRARPYVDVELPETLRQPARAGSSCWTLICRLADDVRARVFVYVPDGFAPIDDSTIRTLFDGCIDGGGFFWAPRKCLVPVGASGGIHRLLSPASTAGLPA